MSTDPKATHIIATELGSGWAAVMVHWNTSDVPGCAFWEPWTTGFGRYATEIEAEREAKAWGEAEGMEYRPSKARKAQIEAGVV